MLAMVGRIFSRSHPHERYAELYLIFADREHAGPATLRLAEIIREAVASECKKSAVPAKEPARERVRNRIKARSS